MARKPLSIEQTLILLAETPQRISELTAGLKTAQLQTPPQPGEWSLNDVLAHLRACADVWGECIETILREDRPTLRAVNPQSWIKKTTYPDQKFRPSFQAYSTQRADLLAVLTPLPPDGWSRSARVVGAGKELERTVQFYAQWLARHERSHLKQIARTAKKMGA